MEEIWKAVPGYEGLYEASNFGQIKSLPRMGHSKNGALTRPIPEKILKQAVGRLGRKQVILYKDKIAFNARVHRLVMAAFVGPCPAGQEVCHNDGNPANNRLDNLRYDTKLANHNDKIIHGTSAVGTKNKASKLDESSVIEIRKLFFAGAKGSEIAKKYGVSHTLVSMIVKRKIWTHV